MFEAIKNKLHFKFRDRIAAANILAAALIDSTTRQELTNNAIDWMMFPIFVPTAFQCTQSG
jgi:hypothetical protein